MSINDLIEILKKRSGDQPVQYLVVASNGEIIAVNLHDDLVDVEKLFKAFRKQKTK